MRPPQTIEPYVADFARQVVESSGDIDLTYLNCTPIEGVPDSECFPIVEGHAERHGGKPVVGWAIWERPKVFIEAEFHAVWETSEKKLKDIAARSRRMPRILFLRDPNLRYTGRQMDNVRKSLADDDDVDELFALCARKHEIMNEGDLANQHGLVSLPREYLTVQREINRICLKLDRRYGPWTPEAPPKRRGFIY